MSKQHIPLNEENLSWLIETYSNDIAKFAIDILNFERFDPWQMWLFDHMLNPNSRKIAVASCHSSGKTLNASVIVLHRLLCFPQARTIITSATEGQLKSAFVTTLNEVIEHSEISDWFTTTKEEITVDGLSGAWIKLRAWSERKPESFAGLHCKSPMCVFDEASGISPKIFEAFNGSMMHENSKMLLLGNPLHKQGELYNAFHGKREFFECMNVSAYDSSFIADQWIEEMKATYGEDSDMFRVRVLGQFPITDIDTFIPEQLIRDAINRQVFTSNNEAVVAGLDVGRYHDASVLVIRQGSKVHKIIRYRTRDTMVLSQLVSKDILKYKIEQIAVDENGVGAGVGDRLRQIHSGYAGLIFGVQLGGLAIEYNKEYFNNRARLWGLAKQWLKHGSIPACEELVVEGSSLLYTFDKHGRYQLESKKDARKRGISSPDHFDALAYSLACTKGASANGGSIGSKYSDSSYDEYEDEVSFNWC